MRVFGFIDKIIDFISEFIAATGIIAGVMLAFVNVVGRYIFNKSFTWSAELTMYFFLWSIFFGAVYCFKKDAHISINLLLDKVNKRIAKFLLIISYLVTVVFLLFVAFYGYKYLLLVEDLGETSIDLSIPMWIPYLVIPISFFFSSYKMILKIFKVLKTPSSLLVIKSESDDLLQTGNDMLKDVNRKTGGLL